MMNLKVSQKPLEYTLVFTEHERFMLVCALRHARQFEKMAEYDDKWLKEIERYEKILDIYKDDEE